MPSKTEEYLALAQRTANGLTRYWESWTAYLTTASRLYKYPFADQLMIYAQRPDATACADYDVWNNRMNRYVRRGSKGIALLDESSGFPRLHYVFDVSDTGVRRNSRDPEVWQYNGKYYVVDGQHTIEGRILRNGGKDLPILCKVYTGLTMEQEALFFAEQNGHAAPLTAGIKLRAKVVGGDAPSKAFLAATNRVGLAFNYDSLQLSDYRISCVGTALKLYNQMGEKIYCESLRLIVAAWEGKPDSFRASVLRGVMHFVELYHGEFSEERLIRALGNVHPMEIYRVGRDNPAKLPGWKKYVFPIYMAYNGKGRKDALSMKF